MSEMPRALVVEDDRAWQDILAEMLAGLGLQVEVVGSLDSALCALQHGRHRLAVVDLSLGDTHTNDDGLAVLDAVRRLQPGCAAILLTGYATVDIAVSAITEHGALTCLRKEAFQRTDFRELVQRVVAEPPAPREASRSEAVDLGSPPSVAKAHGMALVVDDDAGWRDILTELLQEAGYRVRACAGYGEARGCLRRRHYDLAVVDLALPGAPAPEAGLEGYRLLTAARAAGIPTILVTGAAGTEEIERAYSEHGTFACMEKQAFDRRSFLLAVKEARAAGPGEAGPVQALTEREREVLRLLAQGATNREIATALVITENTVKRHLKAVFAKLGVHTRAAAAARAHAAGMGPGFAEKGQGC